MTEDLHYMSRCLQLARLGAGFVAPNPMVGAVIVHNGKIIGEGYHRKYGQAHAEPNAIRSVKDENLLREATLYVNLEPCSHTGKTPPCANLIISKQLKKVVIGTLDPNPKVAGRGVKMLQEAGIEVLVGVLEDECNELNKRFFTYHRLKRPYVTLKWAQSADGFMDINRSTKEETPLRISDRFTGQLTHQMRAENQSIMVGTRTVLLDNPSLTVRNWWGKSPTRIIIDRFGEVTSEYTVFNGLHHTLVFTEKVQLNQKHIEFILIDFSDNILPVILQALYERNIHSVLVEGGAYLLNSFMTSHLWDEINVEIAPFTIGEGVKAPVIEQKSFSSKTFDGHQWLLYKKY